MTNYEQLLEEVYLFGERRTDRTDTGTRSLFSPWGLGFDLRNNRVPLIESKSVPWKMATAEFLWMLSGSTHVKDMGNPAMEAIWSNWANKFGDIGPTYGAQYRDAGGSLGTRVEVGYDEWEDQDFGVDQLARVVNLLATTPDTRRAVISLWSAPELDAMALEPCMVLFQFSLRGPNMDQLELHIYQRSADMMLGVPFDLYQGGLLTHLVARELAQLTGRNIKATRMVWSAGDVHIYENQTAAVELQLEQWRELDRNYPMRATIEIAPQAGSLLENQVLPKHIIVNNYNPQPAINAGKPAI